MQNILLGLVLVWFLHHNPSWFSSVIVLPAVSVFCYVALRGLSSYLTDDDDDTFLMDLENIREAHSERFHHRDRCLVFHHKTVAL